MSKSLNKFSYGENMNTAVQTGARKNIFYKQSRSKFFWPVEIIISFSQVLNLN